MRYASWGIIIDDIVFPDGRSVMGVPGGAGLYAAVGMRLWSPDVLLLSAVGHDFDAEALATFGLTPNGLLVTDLPTPRAWQLFEEDGRRTQIFRVPEEAWYEQLVRAPLERKIPSSVKAAHYVLRGDPREEEMVQILTNADLCLSAEPILDEATTPEERRVILRCLAHFDLFSPDDSGADVLVGERPLLEQLPALAALGPRVVSVRQGAAGSLVFERETGRTWRVPAAEATVVDVTGAGNAYCGGLLVGWQESGDVQRAAAYATVSAAMAIEQVGPPPVDETTMAAARRRAEQALGKIRHNLLPQ
jgi:sugar/nucleoside kinase (ribokinase family)